MKRLKFEVLVDIEDSALDAFGPDINEELSEEIKTRLEWYLENECIENREKFKVVINYNE